MTGKIIIEQRPVPDGLPEDAMVISFNIYGDAELSKIERIAVMCNLASVLSYGPEDWDELLAMVRREPPYDGMVKWDYQIGVSGWVEDAE
ncbi:MAG: hypothetical protein IKM82_00945 [Oscillospiraceae bacterium]|nr:hypothetical protein [Oscillospiraceae bacterium]